MRFALKIKDTRTLEIKGPEKSILLSLKDAGLRDFVMILEGETAGTPVEELLRRWGFKSPATYYRKKKLFFKEGLSALLHHKRGPKHKSRLTDAIIKKVVALRFHSPEKNSAQIAQTLKQQGHSISSRSVDRVLADFGISRSRRSPSMWSLAFGLLLLALTAAPAHAQFYLNGYNPGGNGNGHYYFGGEVTFYSAQFESANSAGGGHSSTDMREALSFYLRGHVWDSRFMKFKLLGTVLQRSYNQESSTMTVGGMGYGGEVEFFHKRHFPFMAYYNVYDQSAKFDQQVLNEDITYTRWGGRTELRFAHMPRFKFQFDNVERETQSEDSDLLYNDEYLTGEMDYSIFKRSNLFVNYWSNESFNEISRSHQLNSTLSARSETSVGARHSISLDGSRTESQSEQPGFLTYKGETMHYSGQVRNNWSSKLNTSFLGKHIEGKANIPEMRSEGDSYGADFSYKPTKSFTVTGSGQQFESRITTLQNVSRFKGQNVDGTVLFSRSPGAWNYSVFAGAGQSDSEFTLEDLTAPGPVEKATSGTQSYSGGGSMGWGGGKFRTSASSSFKSSDFNVDQTAGLLTGSSFSLGYSEDIWKSRFEMRRRTRQSDWNASVEYGTEERLMEDSSFAETTRMRFYTEWSKSTWRATGNYQLLNTKSLNGMDLENTLMGVTFSKKLKGHWVARVTATQSDTTMGTQDLGTENHYEMAIDYHAGKYTMTLLAQRQETAREGFSAESSTYALMMKRKFRWSFF